MIRSRTYRWTRTAGTAVFLIVAFARCSPSPESMPPTGPKKLLVEQENDVNPAQSPLGGLFGSPTPVSQGNVPHRPTPELKHPMDGITESDFIDNIKDLYYDYSPANSQPRFADCVPGSSACDGSADMYIEPEVGMNMRAHHNGTPNSAYQGIPPNGIIVARIINYALGGQASKFGFPAGKYTWWVVDYDSQKNLRSRFFVRDYVNHTVVALKNTKDTKTVYDWSDCGHHVSGRPSRARWYDCDDSADEVGALMVPRRRQAETAEQYIRAVSYQPLAPLGPPMAAELNSVWITCAEGCCTSSVTVAF